MDDTTDQTPPTDPDVTVPAPFANTLFVAFDLDTWQKHDIFDDQTGMGKLSAFSHGASAARPPSFKVVGEYHAPKDDQEDEAVNDGEANDTGDEQQPTS